MKKSCQNCDQPCRYGWFCATCRRGAQRSRAANKIGPDLRVWILRRDGNRCVECGAAESLCVDHIIPIIVGGTTDPDNLQTLCADCNGSAGKGAEDLHGGMRRVLLSDRPIVIYAALADEFGLLKGAILSDCLASPGHLKLGGAFEVAAMVDRLGCASKHDFLIALVELVVDEGVVDGVLLDCDPHCPQPPGWVYVQLNPAWATTGSRPAGNSTGRQVLA